MTDYPGNPHHVIVPGKWDYYCTKCGWDVRDITRIDPDMTMPCEFRTSTIPPVTRPRKNVFGRIFVSCIDILSHNMI